MNFLPFSMDCFYFSVEMVSKKRLKNHIKNLISDEKNWSLRLKLVGGFEFEVFFNGVWTVISLTIAFE